MSLFLVKFTYTPETWAKMITNPEDRRRPVNALAESLGGKLHHMWYAMGEADGYCVVEAPDNESAASIAVATCASGSMKQFSTTALITVEETLEALRRAGEVNFKSPGASSNR